MNDLPEKPKVVIVPPEQLQALRDRRKKALEERRAKRDANPEGREAFDDLLKKASQPKE